MAPIKSRFSPIKAALVAAGVVVVERLGDELLHLVADGLLDGVIQATITAFGG